MSMPGTIERGPARWARGALCALSATLLLAACEDVPSVASFEPITDPAQLFMSLELNHRAINLSTEAPYDTLRLVATPLDGSGQPMSGLPEPTFRSTDTTRVHVSVDGLLEARAATASSVAVIAELVSAENILHVDTAFVKVTTDADPPQLANFEILPQTPDPDMALWPVRANDAFIGEVLLSMAGIPAAPSLRLDARNAGGAPVFGLEVEYRSLDPAIVQLDRRTGVIPSAPLPQPRTMGEAHIVASAWVYGMAVTDTIVFTMTPPLVHVARLRPAADGSLDLSPSEVTIRPGGYVVWANESTTTPVDVTFEDPTNVEAIPQLCMFGPAMCAAGDIATFGGEAPMFPSFLRGRHFPEPGVYEYTITPTGHTGRVIVAEESTT